MTASPTHSRQLLGLFATSAFFGAALLFHLEPFVGKSLLPWYGGTPAVWNTCVFFFQLLLLLGYLYAHVLIKVLKTSHQFLVHAAVSVAALLTLPMTLKAPEFVGNEASPIATLLMQLTTSVGLVFFVISTTAPLLQAWFAVACPQRSPYWLYVASNAGSLTGLLAYPIVVEVWMPLSAQARMLTGGFVLLVMLFAVCGSVVYS